MSETDNNPLNQLIGKRVDVLDKGWIELVDLMPHPATGTAGDLAIVNAARVSFLGESKGPDRDKKLLFYLLRNRHTSPFEMVEFKFRVRAPLVTWWQWARHRVWNFNAQCLSGETEITFNRPSVEARGVLNPYRLKLKDLYRKWHSNQRNQYPIESMRIRVMNEDTMLFQSSTIRNIYASGVKQGFRVKTADGNEITCSKDHRFLTHEGWQTLEAATGLGIYNDRATWKQLPEVCVNGKPLSTAELYTDPEWLQHHYHTMQMSINDMAKLAGCSSHTIRKYLRLNRLTLPERSQAAQFKAGSTPWNTGLHYSFHFTSEQRIKWSEKSYRHGRRGKDHEWWRGGISTERAQIGQWTTSVANQIFERDEWRCAICGGKATHDDPFEAHHIIPIWADPKLTHAYDKQNLITLHRTCHRAIHHKNQELEFAESLSRGLTFDETLRQNINDKKRQANKLIGHFSKIIEIEYIGEIEMYDIAVDGPYHNFVANGFVVHNSGRYTPFEEDDFYVPDVWRLQARDNKQASEGEVEADINSALTDKLLAHYEQGFKLYQEALESGVAKEMARLFLPGFSVYYTWVAKVDAHNLMHFLRLRMASDAQHEIRVYAEAIYEYFFKPALPWTAEAFEQYVLKADESE